MKPIITGDLLQSKPRQLIQHATSMELLPQIPAAASKL